MLKIKEGGILTLAKSLAKTNNFKNLLTIKPPEIIQLNRKLRESFSISIPPKNTPLPKPISKIPENGSGAIRSVPIIKTREDPKISIKKRIEEMRTAAKQAEEEQQNAKKEKAAQEAKKQQEAAIAAQKEQEAIKEQEEKQKQQQEKAQQEKIRIEKEREDKRQRLALLEMEREKKLRQEIERQKQNKNDFPTERDQKTDAGNLLSVLQALSLSLAEKKKKNEKQLSTIPAENDPLEQKRLVFESKIVMIKNSELAAVEAREQEIEKKIAAEKEKLGQEEDLNQEKAANQKIWELEDQRKDIEKQRWLVEDRINKITADADEIADKIADKNSEADLIKQKNKDIAGKENLVKFAVEKIGLQENILNIVNEKENLLPLLKKAADIKNDAEKNLTGLIQKENQANAELSAIEERERQEVDPIKKREIEKMRWNIVNDLKTIVQAKWGAEEKSKEAAKKIESLRGKIGLLDDQIEKIQNNINIREMALEKEGLPIRQIRNAIQTLLKENNIEANPEILKDIVQVQEITDQKKETPAEPIKKEPAIAKKNPDAENATQIQKNKEKEPLATPQKETKNSAQGQVEPGKVVDKNLKDIPAADQSAAAPENNANKPDLAAKNAPALATPAVNPASKLNSSKAEKKPEPALPPETDTAISSGKTPPEIAKIPEAAEIKKTDLKINSFYRGQIDNFPAKNIRAFPQNNPGLADSSGQNFKTEKNETPGGAESLDQKDPELDTLGARNLQNRWEQIKKTTTPAANPQKTTANQANYNQIDALPLVSEPSSNKFLPRMIVFLVVAGILGIALVIILSKNSNQPVKKTTPDVSQPTTAISQSAVNENSQKSPFAPISTIPIYTDDINNVPNLILPYLKKNMDAGYYELLIKDKKNETKITLKQFFNIYGINAPISLYNSLSKEIIPFIYSGNNKNRIGFIASISNSSSLNAAMREWEGSVVQDTDNFFKLSGRKTQTKTSGFKFVVSNTTGGIEYQSIDFSPISDSFSIAWTNYKQKYFIFSASKESLTKMFDQLPK